MNMSEPISDNIRLSSPCAIVHKVYTQHLQMFCKKNKLSCVVNIKLYSRYFLMYTMANIFLWQWLKIHKDALFSVWISYISTVQSHMFLLCEIRPIGQDSHFCFYFWFIGCTSKLFHIVDHLFIINCMHVQAIWPKQW